MSKSEKSEKDSEIISILRFPVSPNFFTRTTNLRFDPTNDHLASRSPLIGFHRFPRPAQMTQFNSPIQNAQLGRSENDFIPLINHQFDLQIDAGKEFLEKPFAFLGNSQNYFPTNLPISSRASPKTIFDPCQILTNSKMVFNPLRVANSPIDRNFFLQDKIIPINANLSSKVLSFSLRKFNNFLDTPVTIEQSNKSDRFSLFNYGLTKKQRPRKLKKKNRCRISKAPREKTRKKAQTCNCKNSECLKDYCKCFRNKDFCGSNCRCRSCKNLQIERTYQKLKGIQRPVQSLPAKIIQMGENQRNKLLLKVGALKEGESKLEGGVKCNCKKSMCVKKYCECFSNGAFCTSNCNCITCSNIERQA